MNRRAAFDQSIDRLGQSPVDHQGLAELSQHHVRGLEVAMQHPPAMGIRHDVADPHEVVQHLPKRDSLPADRARVVKLADSFLERLAAHQSHGVEQATVRVFAQRVNRHDAGVLEPAGDLGLEQKPRPALPVGRLRSLDQLERDFPIEPAVLGDEHFAQAAACQRPQDLKRWSAPRHTVVDDRPVRPLV